MKKNIFIIVIVSFLGMSFHPLHMSVTSIEHDFEKDEFIISMKLFKDDFQQVIKQNYKTVGSISDCILSTNDSIIIIDYINKHFSIKFDVINAVIFLEIEEITCNNESIWIISRIKVDKNFKSIEITNTLMLDLYDDQKNLVIFKSGKVEKGYEFDKQKSNIDIKI